MLEQLNMCVTITSPTVATKVTCAAPWCTGLEGSLPHRLGRLHPPAAWGIAWAACTAWMDGWMHEIDIYIYKYIYIYMNSFFFAFSSIVSIHVCAYAVKSFKRRATYPIQSTNFLPHLQNNQSTKQLKTTA
jgi:hypothetical protein